MLRGSRFCLSHPADPHADLHLHTGLQHDRPATRTGLHRQLPNASKRQKRVHSEEPAERPLLWNAERLERLWQAA